MTFSPRKNVTAASRSISAFFAAHGSQRTLSIGIASITLVTLGSGTFAAVFGGICRQKWRQLHPGIPCLSYFAKGLSLARATLVVGHRQPTRVAPKGSAGIPKLVPPMLQAPRTVEKAPAFSAEHYEKRRRHLRKLATDETDAPEAPSG